jgi:hypothetical protein
MIRTISIYVNLNQLRLLLLVPALLYLVACSRLVQGYSVTPESHTLRAQTSTIEIIEVKPTRDFETLAIFTGNEPGPCPEEDRFCKLRELGKKMGADAVWIQKKTLINNPRQWFFINGKMEEMKPIEGTEYQGCFIRYVR